MDPSKPDLGNVVKNFAARLRSMEAAQQEGSINKRAMEKTAENRSGATARYAY